MPYQHPPIELRSGLPIIGSGPIASAPDAGLYPAWVMWYGPPLYRPTIDYTLPFVLRTSAADNSWLSICWSPELRLFVAVAASGTGNRVMTNSDGDEQCRL